MSTAISPISLFPFPFNRHSTDIGVDRTATAISSTYESPAISRTLIMILIVIIQHSNIDGKKIYNKINHSTRSGSLHLIQRQ